LIGHSGAGKTACLKELGVDYKTADMDAALLRSLLPCESQAEALKGLALALSWLVSHDSRVVTVSNCEKMLYAMKIAKLATRHRDQFASFFLVYLHKPLAELREHLAKPTADGGARSPDGVQYTINNYPRLHTLYSQLTDRTVDCSGKPVKLVAAEVSAIRSAE